MSDYFLNEAEEREEDDNEYNEDEIRKIKKRKIMESDSSEEEEDDEEELKKVSSNFIDDNEEDEEDEADSDDSSDSVSGKRKIDSGESEISDDDLALIEENTGVKIKKKFKRLRRLSDDEESDEEENVDHHTKSSKQKAQDDEDMSEGEHEAEEMEDEAAEESDGSFIVDDDGQPIQKSRKRAPLKSSELEHARDIFGCDFDYGDFEEFEAAKDDLEDDSEVDEPSPVDQSRIRKSVKKTLMELYEPSELERVHLTDRDQIIRKQDIPERFQIREVPVTPTRPEGEDRTTDKELEEEAKWIYNFAFYQPCISDQEATREAKARSRVDQEVTQKIYSALDLMRNNMCEVPFLAFYRKEEVLPELNIHDLWKIFDWDAKWCQLETRKSNLKDLYKRMMQYQIENIMIDPKAPLPDNVHLIRTEDLESIERVETTEQLNDFYRHFLLYYGRDQDKMKEHLKANQTTKKVIRVVKVLRKVKRKKIRKKTNIGEDDDDGIDMDKEDHDTSYDSEEEVETEVETEEEVEEDADGPKTESDQLKKAIRRHEYELLLKANIMNFTRKFGLTPQQFGENVRDSYQRWDVDQCQEDPKTMAETLISKMCSDSDRVLEAAVRIVGWEISCEPLVRNIIRQAYFERAKVTVHCTPKGLKIIDEHHNLYKMCYMKDKPVIDLHGDQFLKLKMGVDEGLVTMTLCDDVEGNTSSSMLEEMKTLYYRDEFSQLVQDWNNLRGRAVAFGFGKVIGDLKKELTQRLLNEAKTHVAELCCRRLYNWLSLSPYNPGDFSEEDHYEWNTDKGFRVLAIAYETDLSQASFGCLVDAKGESSDILRLPHLLKRKNAYNRLEAKAKETDLMRIRDFILSKKPHVVVVGGESREALMVIADIKEILKDLEEQEQFPVINVELMENDFAKVYAVSNKAQTDFLDYPTLLRQAVSLGRRLQDPLYEFSQLCNSDDEILNLNYHNLQNQLTPAELLKALTKEFVNRVNEVGVDLNKVVGRPYMQNVVQFICGLGPRKANALLRSMRNEKRLENRNQLVVSHHMGPKVLINCAGFIKIDTNSLGDSDNYIEILDSTRIHPEAYDWARKMAVDALEYEDEEGKPAEALEEILETPERLSELDLEAFATELYNQGFGKKKTTLYDIRHELNHRYKDFRLPYKPPSSEEIFNMLTKESPDTFFIGKLVQATVIDFIHRKPKGDQLDNANPVRNEETGLWQCPFCLKNDFPELSEVWNHFDAEDCPGQAIGIKVRLDNGISGFINIKNLSDRTVTNPSERVKKFSLIHCRIIKIDPEKFSVELTSRTSDLQDKESKWKPTKDRFYDFQSEEKENSKDLKKLDKKKSQYQKRVISHPAFKNIDYNESEQLMQTMDQGDAIIRPSSKGVDHLTVTWKVSNGICQHIDIREQDKQNDFSLGKKLWIGNDEFEDLDEILARHIAPMAGNARQIIDYKYYKESFQGVKEKCAEYLKEEKRKNPRTIPYIFSPCKLLPGKFLLSYLPRSKVIHEYVTIIPDGMRFRQKVVFPSMAALLKWFKNNFRNISRPTATPMTNRTPYLGNATPLTNVDSSAIQKVAQNLPSHMLHSLSAAASATPFGTPYSTNMNTYNTPYTPSGQTPFMTPYSSTPGPATTPRYGGRSHSQTNRNSTSRADTQWQQVANSWAQGSRKNASKGYDRKSSKFNQEDHRSRFDHQSINATPRSVRSTPKTINSPANMSIGGDQTPLYDE